MYRKGIILHAFFLLILNAEQSYVDHLNSIKAAISRDLYGPEDVSHIQLPKISLSTQQKFLSKSYKYYTKKQPIYVIESSLSQMEFGNHFGRIVNDLACAYKARLHAIVIDTKYDILFRDESTDAGTKFVNELCGVYLHSHPVKHLKNALPIVQTQCQCTQYCWEDNRAPWIDFILPLRAFFAKALPGNLFGQHLRSPPSMEDGEEGEEEGDMTSKAIRTNPSTHITHVVHNISLDLIPSVAIQVRCSDNFRHNMGLLPFPAIFDRIDRHWPAIIRTKRSAPPPHTNISASSSRKVHIYIMTEHPKRLASAPLRGICPDVISSLQSALSKRYPGSIVAVQRGRMFQTWYQFLHADVVICSASTFCLWPALGNSRGTVYLPMTTLFANKTVVNLGVDNVHFIEDYELFGVDANTMNASFVKKVLFSDKKV